ncbi:MULTISPECIES: hypothetical protein [unclassified Lentimonas]|uniref:hypothetical protein n=1 Tax=unclassified Lentimonas TaxID=2630993 RepID=UPI00138A13A7|nr:MULTISPECIES: hypothetical protein [unclassified Lentimonas]
MQKHPLDSKRLRRVPAQFSWVDHRLVRGRLLSGTSTEAWALYLFLVSVADEQGLSYYSSRSICEHLGIDSQQLSRARAELLACDLIAWEAPLYQVLDLSNVRSRRSPAPTAAASPHSATSQHEPVLSEDERRVQGQRLAQTFSDLLKGGAQ